MVQEMSYTTISLVLDSWNGLKMNEATFEKTGVLLFSKLFHKSPETKALFGFPKDVDPMSEEFQATKRFRMHAKYMTEMLDTALNMLGPDIELLTEILLDLGQKHKRFGVKPDMFPIMGECLMETLQEISGSSFDKQTQFAWEGVYDQLTNDIIQGHQSV